MDGFFFDDKALKKVNMGYKKKDLGVQDIKMINEEERKKRQLHKLQMESATTIQKELRRVGTRKMIAERMLGDEEQKGDSV